MKILFVNEYTTRRGGVDRIVDAEIDGLVKRNYEVKLFSIKHNSFYDKNQNLILKKLIGVYFNIVNQLQYEIDRIKPDVIHFHNIYPIMGMPIWSRIKKGNSKIIVHLHNFYPFCINSFFFRNYRICTACFDSNSRLPGVFSKCYNNSYLTSIAVSILRQNPQNWVTESNKVDQFIGVSNFICNKYQSFGIVKSKLTRLYNFTTKKTNIIKSKGDYILYVGDVVDAKGISIVCESAVRLPYINFIIAGAGRDLEKYKICYKNYSNIKFIGYIDGTAKETLISNCRFLFLPYLSWEAFGIVIIEAYNCGKPVITSGFGGSSEIVRQNKTGLILSSLDIEFVKNQVQSFWNELELDNNYFENCLKYAEQFRVENHVDELIEIYWKCLIE